MKVTVITFCLIGAVFANPISYNVILESNELDANTTESLSLSQSSENDTSEPQSSEENTSNQSSESESLESTSEDKTSEESNSQSDEDNQISHDFISETRDNSMSSEENVRKNLVPVFESVAKVLSAEDNSSTEVQSQSDLSKEMTGKQPVSTTLKQMTKTVQGEANMQLVETPTDSSDTTSESADSSDITSVTATTGDSSDSTSSDSTSSESNETSEDSKSTEDSNASDSTELVQVKTKDCVNGTQSCESEEHFFQNVGDDAHYSVDNLDNLMVPDEDDRELSLRR